MLLSLEDRIQRPTRNQLDAGSPCLDTVGLALPTAGKGSRDLTVKGYVRLTSTSTTAAEA